MAKEWIRQVRPVTGRKYDETQACPEYGSSSH
jgi:hypothetical protein